MESILAIFAATVVQFILGFVWYGLLFGNLWGRMHGFDKLSKETQDKMKKEVAPLYGVQLIVTILTSIVLSIFITNLPADWNPYGMAFFFWLGFILPILVSSVIFGGTEGKWIVKKIAVQAGYYLVALQAAVFVLENLPF
jgi:hypothetical protein